MSLSWSTIHICSTCSIFKGGDASIFDVYDLSTAGFSKRKKVGESHYGEAEETDEESISKFQRANGNEEEAAANYWEQDTTAVKVCVCVCVCVCVILSLSLPVILSLCVRVLRFFLDS